MPKLSNCHTHSMPINRICGMPSCCKIMCENCFISHQMETSHHISVILNNHSLHFFTSFTGYIQYKMVQWADTIRRSGFDAIFITEGLDDKNGHSQEMVEQLKQKGVNVLLNYEELMKNNRSFVATHQESQELFHPQFLKDVFTLLVEKWKNISQIITNNLHNLICQNQQLNHYYGACKFYISSQLLDIVEKEKNGMITKIRKEVLVDVANNFNSCQALNKVKRDKNTKDNSNSGQNKQNSREGQEVSQFEAYCLPWSIKMIQSVEEIGSHQSNKLICSIQNDLTQRKLEKIDQILEENYQSTVLNFKENSIQSKKTAAITKQNQSLKSKNKELISQNKRLTEENQLLKQQNQTLKQQRINRSSSKNKSEPDSELLYELVQLEVEMKDSKHDIDVLVDYINQLSVKQNLNKNELHNKLGILKTIQINY